MCNIDEIMEMLDWNKSDEIQQKGIELAKNIKHIASFVLPCESGKSVLENCAKILADKSDERLRPYLLQLLDWLQDMNWPGAEIILERLKVYVEVESLAFCIDCRVAIAVACSKFDDMKLLDNISDLLDNEHIKEALSSKTVQVLVRHYNNHGWWDEE